MYLMTNQSPFSNKISTLTPPTYPPSIQHNPHPPITSKIIFKWGEGVSESTFGESFVVWTNFHIVQENTEESKDKVAFIATYMYL